MRSESEIISTIIEIARNNENIKAVCLNGSRADKTIKKDKYQDFDIVYIVENMGIQVSNLEWINQFGKRTITQYPALEDLYQYTSKEKSPILMLFDDFNRIDLTIISKSNIKQYLQEEKITQVLLDKESLFSSQDIYINKNSDFDIPYQKVFDECVTEFYWISTNVMKGLWREELIYSMTHLNIVREMLFLILSWKINLEAGSSIDLGKHYKYIVKHLNSYEYNYIHSSYPNLNKKEIVNSLYTMIKLFDETALKVSHQSNVNYTSNMYNEVKKYIGYIDTV
ncbi:aminoglycoside 6-adenylyltransferase [Staphylococcus caeli]|uniref:Aminoglycoside adenyltransferase n=1 Tax=Staphylococcus caeli TaxID=2201815 RepID=A0A1D4Q5M2_9STAP|nr:aminoglycoside 6-adenylyltransferase [Staphylococcus caeli]SCT23121.1 aminoglycoside adenyltransferase [Staphylococcus caeli]SCT30365.1 aminoglycoside adenyltransferase [Staphylococcus caeli]